MILILKTNHVWHLEKKKTDNNEALFVSNNKPYERLQSRGIELML